MLSGTGAAPVAVWYASCMSCASKVGMTTRCLFCVHCSSSSYLCRAGGNSHPRHTRRQVPGCIRMTSSSSKGPGISEGPPATHRHR